MRLLFTLFIFVSTLSLWSQVQDDAIIASIERTGDQTFDVVFTFQRAVTGTGNPINVYLKVPENEVPAGEITVTSSFALARSQDPFPFEGSQYFVYQGQPSINLANYEAGDRLIAGSFTMPPGSSTNEVRLSGGGDFAQDNFNTGAGFIWTGTSLLTDNTVRNLVTWPIDDAIFLPVAYARPLTARPAGKTALLEWATAEEVNNHGFHVQHSIDEVNFTTIGFVPAGGRSSDYEFVHVNPETGVNYYRLQQEDLDGTTALSVIRDVTFSSVDPIISISPNPTADVINIGGLDVEKQINVRISDVNGRLLLERSGISQLSVRDLATGTYVAEIQNGNRVVRHKVIIRR